ncbi:hybrid sensor histidine kinase/response regulator [Phenylobacterium sp.]|jgi:signal transduction histidine kinase|uniref:hybrid sensor histidine kinase/response regulator n=1 Tax=Phenylobacterium sp. TaxID=1871053 RepID=UPI002F3FA35B
MRNGAPFHLDDLPIAMAALDDDLCVLAANPCFGDMAGGGDLTGRDVIELMTSICISAERQAGAQVFHLRMGLEDRWLRLDFHRRPSGVLAILVDVTAEREALEELRFAYATRDRLMDQAEVGYGRFDPDLEVYIYRDADGGMDTAARIDLASVMARLHPDDAVTETAVRELLVAEGGSAENEVRFRQPGGWAHRRTHHLSGRRMPSGRYEVYSLTQDITALALARDEAKAAAQQLKLALTSARAGVFAVDFPSNSFAPSAEFMAMVAPEARAAGPQNPLPFFHEDDRARLIALYQTARHRHSAGSADVRLSAPDGVRWVRLYLEVQNENGRSDRGVGLMLDIDDQKRQELALTEARRVAEAATDAKSTFLASMSHEIRTPMNGIVGVLNLLRREKLSADGQHLLDEALGCSEMLAQLINDVLDFSKIEAGKLDLSPTAADPAAIVRSVVNLIAPQAEAKGVDLGIQVQDALGGAALDPVRLRQCLFNVVGNAVKFTDHGKVEVRLAYLDEGAGRRLRCEVQDTGVGVPFDARARLFDRFQQADDGATRRFGGTGLGLAISRSLARMMGGDMDFESEVGVGSTFWFEVTAPPAAAPQVVAENAFAGAPLEGLRILVVDDNATNRLVAVKSLEALGAVAEAVDSGAGAIAAAPHGGFDVILMDVNMPQMDGLEATRRIRAMDSPAAQVPIIAHTADVMNHQQAGYRAAGMNGVVSKPFSPPQLLAEIARLAGADLGDQALSA